MLPEEIHAVFDNGLPATISTSDPEGEPNVTALSAVHWVDPFHVALSFQFFSKTIRNIRAHPFACVSVSDFNKMVTFVMDLEFVREETEGKTFEEMDMRIQAIASMVGLEDVFKLRGAHIYKVLGVQKLDFAELGR